MPLRYDTEEEREEVRKRRSGAGSGRATDSDTEIALGSRSLLAIFFGLVLICAVFFGLGYSVGRASGTRATEAPATETASSLADSRVSKPSADQALTPVETPSNESGTPSAQAASEPQATVPASAAPAASTPSTSAAAPVNPFQSPASSATPADAKSATLQPAAATIATGLMVQVAAVRVPQDAQILVDALKKHGYTAVVRNEPQDQLLHIQLGPFSSRPDAMAMRAKLLSDGYNAVVK
jgi:cell division septation protein DedD